MTNREMFNKFITSQCEKVVAMSDEELLNRMFKYGAWPAHELYEFARVMGFEHNFDKPELLEWLQLLNKFIGEQTMTEKLERCFRCGEKPKLKLSDTKKSYFVICEKCRIVTRKFKKKTSVISAWNEAVKRYRPERQERNGL